MGDYSFNIWPLVYLPILALLFIYGIWKTIDYIFIDEVIKSEYLIKPEIKLVVKDNVVDTIYIYKHR